MTANVISAAIVGLDSKLVKVEVDVARGLPHVSIVGLPDAAVQEARDRVRSAIKNSGLTFPATRVTINLAPASLRKEGSAYDLPIALGILQAAGELEFSTPGKLFVGELALDGSLRHVNGVLSVVTLAKDQGRRTLFVPAVDAAEAGLVSGIEIVPVQTLSQLVGHLTGRGKIARYKRADKQVLAKEVFAEQSREQLQRQSQKQSQGQLKGQPDLSQVKGQENAKRALEIAAAGGHNILLHGPPGSGKTLLARTMPSILPEMSTTEIIETTKIYSIAGRLPTKKPMIVSRPFRSPHHSASGASLVGGGSWPRPGEVSLAHRGVLFLDEIPEFGRQVLESLRQPLEDSVVQICRSQQTVTFPAKFMLIASMNPCPCGFYQDVEGKCTCSPRDLVRYQKRLSGPVLDRIDLHVEVPRVSYEKLTDDGQGGISSREVRKRVQKARAIQTKRLSTSRALTNSEMNGVEIKKHCQVGHKSQELLRLAVEKMNLSARGYFRVLKLARTIADLEATDQIRTAHVAEALQYRGGEL